MQQLDRDHTPYTNLLFLPILDQLFHFLNIPFGEPVDIGRLDGTAVTSEVPIAQVVGDNEDDIGFACWRGGVRRGQWRQQQGGE